MCTCVHDCLHLPQYDVWQSHAGRSTTSTAARVQTPGFELTSLVKERLFTTLLPSSAHLTGVHFRSQPSKTTLTLRRVQYLARTRLCEMAWLARLLLVAVVVAGTVRCKIPNILIFSLFLYIVRNDKMEKHLSIYIPFTNTHLKLQFWNTMKRYIFFLFNL